MDGVADLDLEDLDVEDPDYQENIRNVLEVSFTGFVKKYGYCHCHIHDHNQPQCQF